MVSAAGVDESATAYGTGGRGGRSHAETDEVWLRGNVRPVVAAGAAVCGVLAVACVGAALAGAAPSWPFAVALGAVVAIVAALARAASGPRLGRRDGALLVRLSPWRAAEVPLDVVECVFPGSQPLTGPVLTDVHAADGADVDPPARRVGTLVIRFAERAREWRERPTFAPWGTWHDGHAIIDGRWCEPLSAETAQVISRRLLEAKREVAAAEGGP